MMEKNESAIACEIRLVPGVPMPFGIVCTLASDVPDHYSFLQRRMTIRVPLWDMEDLHWYTASLTRSGHGIVLSMPATASWLKDYTHVEEITEWIASTTNDRKVAQQQVTLQHQWFCNRFRSVGGSSSIVKVLLLFENGQTFHNRSFNRKVPPYDFVSLERKPCAIKVEPTNMVPYTRVHSAVIFEAAMTKQDGDRDIPTKAPVQEMDPVAAMLRNLEIRRQAKKKQDDKRYLALED
jgi:hypothetical protein